MSAKEENKEEAVAAGLKKSNEITTKVFDKTDVLSVNTIRVLAADVVQKANSGHPGMPMAMAPIGHILWTKYLNLNPLNPKYFNRDRFVLSNGHGCALLYSLLHLSGFKITMDDLKNFRQLNSKTPGHPENFLTEGVEVSTGPLGQGISQAVGLAVAQKKMANMFNKKDCNLFDHRVWVFCGDGCLQEGVSSEACSLAGHWKLNNLIVIYDDNNITIDGKTELSFTENVPKRFEAYGWETFEIKNGNTDMDEMDSILKKVTSTKQTKPILISLKTLIGFGSSKENTHGVHGSPLGPDVLKEYKKVMGFDPEKSFNVDESVYKKYQNTILKRGQECQKKTDELLKKYEKDYPNDYKELQRILSGKLPDDYKKVLTKYDDKSPKLATRNINGAILNQLAEKIPEIVGGAADLTPSTKTQLKCSHDYQTGKETGRYIRFGVREFGMFAIGNGISAYGCGLIPFTSTFLNFITYGWGAVRLGAISHLQHIYIMTHDSIFLGEDGPTHQPIEVLPLLRCTPNIMLFRPADGNENNAAWIQGIELNKKTPTVIALSRQKIPAINGTSIENSLKGAYILSNEEEKDNLDLILIGTGTEIPLCLDAKDILIKSKVNVRVVSAPCLELFTKQSSEYKKNVLKEGPLIVSVEAASTQGWNIYSHKQIGVNRFGASAPLKSIQEFFGFTPDKVAKTCLDYLEKVKGKKLPLVPCNYDF